MFRTSGSKEGSVALSSTALGTAAMDEVLKLKSGLVSAIPRTGAESQQVGTPSDKRIRRSPLRYCLRLTVDYRLYPARNAHGPQHIMPLSYLPHSHTHRSQQMRELTLHFTIPCPSIISQLTAACGFRTEVSFLRGLVFNSTSLNEDSRQSMVSMLGPPPTTCRIHTQYWCSARR